MVEPRRVGAALFGPYVLAVELAGFLLLAGLVGAYHLGRKDRPEPRRHDTHPAADPAGTSKNRTGGAA